MSDLAAFDIDEAAVDTSSRREWESALVRRSWVTDAIVVIAAVAIAQLVRFGTASPVAESDSIVDLNYSLISAIIALSWIAALAIYGTHSPRIYGCGPDEYRLILSATVRLFGAIAICALIFRIEIARLYVGLAFLIGLTALLLSRWFARRAIARQREKGENQTAVLVVGRESAVFDLARSFERYLASGHRVVGVCIPGHSGAHRDHLDIEGRPVPIFGDEHSVLSAVKFSGADTVAVTATEELGHNGIRKLVWELDPYDVDLVVSPGVVDVAGPRLVMRPVAGLPLIHVDKPTYRGTKRFGKTIFDVCFAVFALILSAPILLLTALAVKIDSRGPVLYRSERVGMGGKTFGMLKFRSMVDGADQQLDDLMEQNEGAGVLFKMRDDPRVTRVGRIIRKLSIDELPQFINVLKRDMSVVGPRPPLRREVEDYDGEVRRRLLVKPGVTGLWQVSGRSVLSWEESVRLDLSYVENWSTVGDLLIIVKTVRAVVAGWGAY
ncbi:sugar transferase [Antrihabitans sp. YC2-6]|uniref:sugar transferase n=1 Tax=Antrihabitans sp. YC2-6 TaxID=2799498 RepID=UPI0035A8C951